MTALRWLPFLLGGFPGVLLANEDFAFFESKVRPLLVERCYECHSHEKKIKGGLALDSREGWVKGGDTGAAIVPGKPGESLVMQAVSWSDPDLTMPPKKKLSATELGILTEWIQRGAPDPRTAAPAGKKLAGMSLEAARSYWAFQPVAKPAVPASSASHPIDAFVQARLAQENLSPSSAADPRTLIRRVYFDLIGLPPTYEEVAAFAATPTPEAFARVVDQLLARPEYGQRWGRHWLDVARYADTTEKSTDGERRIPFAHTYRDYVVEAFNADKPFDRFILEQLAADRLPAAEKPDLRALGFLTVGRRFEGNAEAPQLIIDDQIDVIGRGFLGLTLACARCHDHKFDAIPTADYYSLYGILASSTEPLDRPEIGQAPKDPAVEKYREKRAELFEDYEEHIDTCTTKAYRLLRELAPEYLRYLVESSPNHRTVEGFIPLDTPRGLLVHGGAPRWEAAIEWTIKQGDPFFALWKRLLALPRADFAALAADVLAEDSGTPMDADPEVLARLQAKPPQSMLDVAEAYGEALQKNAALAARLNRPDSPLQFSREEIRADLLRFITEHQLVSRPDGEAAGKIREKITVLEATAPVERASVVTVSPQLCDPHVLIRGDRQKPGAAVPRRFLQVLASIDARSYADDGRLEIARAIANPGNPLTARVIVNRVWQQHFGTGLVATPDNFGVMGEKPSHPELLDHLATWFFAHGNSLKALNRYILTSTTWQQSSAPQSAALEKDPANRLLWRMSPRRLEFEPLRDAVLQVADRLDVRAGGRSAPLKDQNFRRALYGYTDRFRVPALLRNFDVANPDTSISHRAETIHPLQALFFLNSPFIRTQAETIAKRPEIAHLHEVPEQIRALYRRVLARQPDAEEMSLATEYLGPAPDARAWANFTQALLLSNEFTFCD